VAVPNGIQTTFDHLLRENPMGEARKDTLRLDFDRKKKGVAQKTMFSCQFSMKLPRKRKFLTVQGDFDKIIDTDRGELCFLSV
jgi:hypothetical protein